MKGVLFMNAGVKIKVFSAQELIDYLVCTDIFVVASDIHGTGGARTVSLRPIMEVAQLDIIVEQPHHSRLDGWRISTDLEITLPCLSIAALERIYDRLSGSNVEVTEFFDRPWGGQFSLILPNEIFLNFFNIVGSSS